jgi:hypothetical protein
VVLAAPVFAGSPAVHIWLVAQGATLYGLNYVGLSTERQLPPGGRRRVLNAGVPGANRFKAGIRHCPRAARCHWRVARSNRHRISFPAGIGKRDDRRRDGDWRGLALGATVLASIGN